METDDVIRLLERLFSSDEEFLENILEALSDEELETFLKNNPEFLK